MRYIVMAACILAAGCSQQEPKQKVVYYTFSSPEGYAKRMKPGWRVGINFDAPRVPECEDRAFKNAQEGWACIKKQRVPEPPCFENGNPLTVCLHGKATPNPPKPPNA